QLLASEPITDMTVLAQQFPRHPGPTALYLNFDGWQDRGISPFLSTTGDRERDIQEILYRTAEVFAPFDVHVVRRLGDGSLDLGNGGNTTIFIGDYAANGQGTKGLPGVFWKAPTNRARSFTPSNFVDYPSPQRGIFHAPNSDPYDLAYVDPVGAKD